MNKNLLKISIVTPSFNQGKFLEETILSVINQNYKNLEYILIDGGSTDDSVDIIKKYQDKLSYWISEKDNGQAHALNKGFSKTTGEIMGWINSDDKYYQWTFNVVSEIFQKFPDVNWIVGINSWFDEKGRLYKTEPVFKNIYDFLTNQYQWIQQESVFWRRSLWEKAGGKINENYKLMIDGELWCRFFLYDDLWHVDRIIGGFRKHNENRSKIYFSQVINELNSAVIELKKNISSDVLKSFTRINKIRQRRQKISDLIKKIKPYSLSVFFNRLFSVFEKCSNIYFNNKSAADIFDYKIIKYDTDWYKSTEKFIL